jgi:GalNAc-alpha-(1->4)-GalNAc-alpha-(1->3)-diNAcBac-PP-undecaprenol alpha-1,4-N-acetyl-D-galactosaminyltransferase
MRIALLTSSMGAGGAERVASTLVNAWDARGDRVALMPTFSGGGDCFYQLSPSVELVYLATAGGARAHPVFSWVPRLRAMRRFMVAWRPDVVVSFLTNVNIAAILASIGLTVPVVACERVDPFVRPLALPWRLGCRIAYPWADALVVQTSAVADKYASSWWPWSRVRIIPNPIPPRILEVSRQEGQANSRILLAVGRLSPQKQFDALIRVFARLVPHHEDWRLRIIGEGPMREALRRQSDRLGVGARVELPGRTSTVERELAAADAFALSSRYEGFPNGLLEALAAGLPCVAFDCASGPREITMAGDVALLVPADDERALEASLDRLMSDASLRASLGVRARRSVGERYGLQTILGQWDSLFREIGAAA